jgi:hypothetical protein
MTPTTRRRHTVGLTLAGLCVPLTLAATATPAQSAPRSAPLPAHQGAPPGGPVSWLAAGDSYSSGEGIPGSGMGIEDDCAQSPRAFGPKAADILRRTRSWQVTPLAFTACTGAIIADFYTNPNKSHPTQAAWSRQFGAPGGKFDVITMSFGGNDVTFADILVDCLLPNSWGNAVSGQFLDGCPIKPATLTGYVDDLVAGKSTKDPSVPFVPGKPNAALADFYTSVVNTHLAPGGVLVVVGYPRLFAPSEQWAPWRGGLCGMFPAADADMLGDAAVELEDALKSAVAAANSSMSLGRTIRFVSRVKEFDNNGSSHSLCSSDTSWMNGLGAILTRNGEFRTEHAFHPNEIGHTVTARDVAGYVEDAVNVAQAAHETESNPDPEPSDVEDDPTPIDDGSQLFGIGDEFSAICSVAWPTAPTYTATTIELTMSCPDVPQQFLFVSVSYPDPNLPINPSTGAVRVHGQVVNIGTSAYGYKTLYVAADEVDLGG